MNLQQKHKAILSGCIAISVLFHALALGVFQRYSLWFSTLHPQNPDTWVHQLDKKECDEILQTAFAPQVVASPQTPPLIQEPELQPEPLKAHPTPINEPDFCLSLFQQPFPAQELAGRGPIPTFATPVQPLNLLEHLPKELIVAPPQKWTPPTLFPVEQPFEQHTLQAAIPTETSKAPLPLITYSDQVPLTLTDTAVQTQAPQPIHPIPLPQLPTLEDLETSSYSDTFDTDLIFLKQENGRYVFALTLIPRSDLDLPSIPQQFTFLIDRSNSIQQDRLNATKSALLKALTELTPEDTFNIIVFDNKIEKLALDPLPCNAETLSAAEDFLQTIQLGSFFAAADLYKPLFLTVPRRAASDVIHTAILLTDSESLGKKPSARALLHDWTTYNAGKVCLYALGINGDPHIATLETATLFNKGKLFSAPTPRGLKRKLVKLIKTIHSPIAKNLVYKAISRSPKSNIQLFPKATQTPHLYLDQPYVILGETDTLDDFILFVQGRIKNRWINIKKSISFVNAKKGGRPLKKEWALQLALELYEHYVADENQQHLVDAKALLEPYDFQVALQ